MASYAPITTGLVKTNSPHELLPGEVYLVRFKNSCREYKTDLWLGVILTEEDGPGKNLHGRAKGAKPAEGVWTTPLSERVYPVFMPGRNSYRWTPVGDMFNLEAKVPGLFRQGSDRDDAALFRRIQQIALKKPDYLFWKRMSEKELHVKGKRSRVLELEVPEGYEDILDGIERPLDEDDSMNGPSELDAGPMSPPPHKVQASTPSLSESRAAASTARASTQHLSFPGESSSFPTYMRGPIQQGPNPWSTDSEEVTIKTEPGSRPSIIQASMLESSFKKLTISQAIDDILLGTPEAAEILGAFDDILRVQNQPEAAKLKSYLETKEFEPLLIQILNPAAPNMTNAASESPTKKGTSEPFIGDCLRMGRVYQLKGVKDSEALQQEIISLGHLYTYASHFHKTSLIRLITQKLQVAWNSYPGVFQLRPLLDVAMIACRDASFAASEKKDHLQDWIVRFVADTMDLFLYDCGKEYLQVLREAPALHEAVIEMRKKHVANFPERYTDIRILLRSRGIKEI
ncbi:hypothetical protein N7456_008739 [Penicillium angulare]|uniref:Uncharacterized protein n=1 Tax=Penicillium angulare TaxID=116970 RepID=A0A9W9K4J6_9EURO|nr:hypothetical protein N7456_008739 [Penicillium angulare]